MAEPTITLPARYAQALFDKAVRYEAALMKIAEDRVWGEDEATDMARVAREALDG